MKKDYIFYEVSLKLLLHKKERVLVLRTEEEDIDLPGGRIEKGEEKASFKEILSREIKEELGANVRYRIREPLFCYRGFSQYGFWVFIIVHKAEYLGGTIKLSKEHKNYEWIDKQNTNFKRSDFPDWDLEKYLAFKKYFSVFHLSHFDIAQWKLHQLVQSI